jgi:NADH-quinone oxidoreductase subunit N
MLLAIVPEISIIILAAFILIFDAVWKPQQKRTLGWITAGGLILIIVLSVFIGRPGSEPTLVFGGMLSHDWFSFTLKMLFLFGAAITALFAMDLPNVGDKGEFYLLLLVSTLGMNLMVSASDLILLYLAIETTSIPQYILAGFLNNDNKSTESGFKYLLFGAMASTIMLYGFSLLYGFAGSTNINEIATAIHSQDFPLISVVGSLMLIMVGFGFKISVFPFHFWAPDVYEGAPTPVAGFLSTASKAAGFAVLVRFLLAVFTPIAVPYWTVGLAVVSVITMTLGNSLALAQSNIKRLLAYSLDSSCWIYLDWCCCIESTCTASCLYLIVYLITNLAAFGIVVNSGR